ncbi:MAG: hypothetical protein AAFN41_10775, partial [Planctomycetota bacterium]
MSTWKKCVCAAAAMIAAAGTKAEPRLLGVTATGEVVEIDVATGAAVPLFAVSGGGSMAYEPQSGMLAIKLNDDLDTEIL